MDDKKKNIDEDTKIFLRSVLNTEPGIQQRDICKKYREITGDALNFVKLGYPNIYELLKDLEGEVVRIEFSEKREDNILYCVQDPTKYVSKHLMKYAAK